MIFGKVTERLDIVAVLFPLYIVAVTLPPIFNDFVPSVLFIYKTETIRLKRRKKKRKPIELF